jgi:hypothetical protein
LHESPILRRLPSPKARANGMRGDRMPFAEERACGVACVGFADQKRVRLGDGAVQAACLPPSLSAMA